jgi:hypothetical protein
MPMLSSLIKGLIMQKICTIIILSSMLFVANSIGMELQDLGQIDSKVMWDFVLAGDQGNAPVFIKTNSHIVSSWVKRSSYSGESYPLLHCLVECDAVSAAKALLAAGADVYINTATEVQKHTPLHMVQSKEMAELLLKYDADLEAKDNEGRTPLSHVLFHRKNLDDYSGHFCGNKGDHDKRDKLRHYLLEQGADSNTVDKEGNSLLHKTVGGYSFSYRYPEYITLLMQFGADTEIKDSSEKTVYDCAIDRISHNETILEALRKFNIVFLRDALLREISWRDENGERQICKAGNFLEFLQNGAPELKECILENPGSYQLSKVKEILANLLKMAQKNEHNGKITYYKDRGYLFNKVNMADLEEWCGKDSVDYLCQYLKI